MNPVTTEFMKLIHGAYWHPKVSSFTEKKIMVSEYSNILFISSNQALRRYKCC